jgi:hypothetical protein
VNNMWYELAKRYNMEIIVGMAGFANFGWLVDNLNVYRCWFERCFFNYVLCSLYVKTLIYLGSYVVIIWSIHSIDLTYLLHGAESFLRS